eukprot:NODE_9446_length_1424_cov_4.465690.p1 GENE.NODE_9446_length_1424_cov_4.465690~~NODE_9446_length_1424_cov_4.465690.p1  ORF type:complete len:370 (-),score=54.53 NODE_9446_length_1424_cov_4.465690:204-1313(-)
MMGCCAADKPTVERIPLANGSVELAASALPPNIKAMLDEKADKGENAVKIYGSNLTEKGENAECGRCTNEGTIAENAKDTVSPEWCSELGRQDVQGGVDDRGGCATCERDKLGAVDGKHRGHKTGSAPVIVEGGVTHIDHKLNSCSAARSEEDVTDTVVEIFKLQGPRGPNLLGVLPQPSPISPCDMSDADARFEYTLCIDRPQSVSLGLELDLVDGVGMVVTQIEDTCASKLVTSGTPLAVHDRIIEVDGERGHAQTLINMLEKGGRARLRFQRPRTVRATLQVSANTPLGIDICYFGSGRSLVVHGVHPGLLKTWNSTHPEDVVGKYDRIIGVNGKGGTSIELLQRLSSKEKPLQLDLLCFALRPRT